MIHSMNGITKPKMPTHMKRQAGYQKPYRIVQCGDRRPPVFADPGSVQLSASREMEEREEPTVPKLV